MFSFNIKCDPLKYFSKLLSFIQQWCGGAYLPGSIKRGETVSPTKINRNKLEENPLYSSLDFHVKWGLGVEQTKLLLSDGVTILGLIFLLLFSSGLNIILFLVQQKMFDSFFLSNKILLGYSRTERKGLLSNLRTVYRLLWSRYSDAL